jgi:signal peptidase I
MLDFENIKLFEENRRKSMYFTMYFAVIIAVCLMFIVIFRASVTNGSSMYPTLEDGELLISMPTYLKSYGRGDIVIINSEKLDEKIIKRVIAVEGDTIKITEDGAVFINGEQLEESYLNYVPDDYKSPVVYGKVPENCVFVMGDNRSVSNDSRYFGFVQESEITSVLLTGLK